ncbi:MAG: putative bifunctional diguanylate cyclase/phosphodiesterase [Acidobacteriota bacterium]
MRQVNNLVLQINKKGILLDFKGRLENFLLTATDEILGKSIYDIMPPDIAQSVMQCTENALHTGDVQGCEYQSPTSEHHYELKFIVNAKDSVFAFVSNISDYRRAAEKARYLAHHDTLTNLPNRYLFNDRLKQAIAHAERGKKLLAILFLDLDNFKQINDTIGHRAGDQLLQIVADRLMKGVRETDTAYRPLPDEEAFVVARLGGDEFTVMLTDIRNIQDPAKVAGRMLNALSQPFTIGAHEVFITASVGIAVYPLDGKDVDTLLINADVAMYQAKKQGRNNSQYYSASLNDFTIERFSVENKLRKALDHNEFMLFYQPQISISEGRMIGVEALIRWLQPDLVFIKPSEFIPLAEETGLIVPIGEWILRSACAQNRAWQKAGLQLFPVTVNVSSVQFRQNNFVETVSQILRETGLKPDYLQLELTESTIMYHSENINKKLQSLQAMGIQISIDDFGTGYSSMNYLKRFPLSTLKIDQSFVRDLVTNPTDQAIVKAIVALAHNFNLKVIAEGVETREQLAFLRGCRCEGMQGYLVCPPLNPNTIVQFARKGKYL